MNHRALEAIRARIAEARSTGRIAPVLLAELAQELERWYHQTWNIEYLNERISLIQELLASDAQAGSTQPDTYHHLTLLDLASALEERYAHNGLLEDLQARVEVCRQATAIFASPDPLHIDALVALGWALCDHQQRHKDPALTDLKEAFEAVEAALAACPDGHPRRYLGLHILGRAYSLRGISMTVSEDHNRAVEYQRQGLALCPDNNANRPILLLNLALSWSMELRMIGKPEDTPKAMALFDQALELLAENHPRRTLIYANIAFVHASLYGELNNENNAELSFQYCEKTLACQNGNYADRKVRWVPILSVQFRVNSKR
jgi:tetratricopeptide (TPR) repeat protein